MLKIIYLAERPIFVFGDQIHVFPSVTGKQLAAERRTGISRVLLNTFNISAHSAVFNTKNDSRERPVCFSSVILFCFAFRKRRLLYLCKYPFCSASDRERSSTVPNRNGFSLSMYGFFRLHFTEVYFRQQKRQA